MRTVQVTSSYAGYIRSDSCVVVGLSVFFCQINQPRALTLGSNEYFPLKPERQAKRPAEKQGLKETRIARGCWIR
jgi:hypothetical protein